MHTQMRTWKLDRVFFSLFSQLICAKVAWMKNLILNNSMTDSSKSETLVGLVTESWALFCWVVVISGVEPMTS